MWILGGFVIGLLIGDSVGIALGAILTAAKD